MKLLFENWRKYLLKEAYKEERDAFTELIGDPRAFFTMSTVSRLGVYPLSKYNTPNGIYCYPLSTKMTIDLVAGGLPFKEYAPLIHIFLVDWNKVLDFNRYTTTDLKRDLQILSKAYPKKSVNLQRAEKLYEDSPFFGSRTSAVPGARLWAMTWGLQKGTNDWSKILSKVLGYDGAIDPGYGIIFSNEPNQAVFFTQGQRINIIKVITLKNGKHYKDYVKDQERDLETTVPPHLQPHKAVNRILAMRQLEGLGKPRYDIKNIEIPETVVKDYMRLYPGKFLDKKLYTIKGFQEVGGDLVEKLSINDPVEYFENDLHKVKAYQKFNMVAAKNLLSSSPLLFFRFGFHDKFKGLENEIEVAAKAIAMNQPRDFLELQLWEINENIKEIGKIAITTFYKKYTVTLWGEFFENGAHEVKDYKELGKVIAKGMAENKQGSYSFAKKIQLIGKFYSDLGDTKEFVTLLKMVVSHVDTDHYFRLGLWRFEALKDISKVMAKKIVDSDAIRDSFFGNGLYKLPWNAIDGPGIARDINESGAWVEGMKEAFQEMSIYAVKRLIGLNPVDFFRMGLNLIEDFEKFGEDAVRHLLNPTGAYQASLSMSEKDRMIYLSNQFLNYDLGNVEAYREIAKPFFNKYAALDPQNFIEQNRYLIHRSHGRDVERGAMGAVEALEIAVSELADRMPSIFFKLKVYDRVDVGQTGGIWKGERFKRDEKEFWSQTIRRAAGNLTPHQFFKYAMAVQWEFLKRDYPDLVEIKIKELAKNPKEFFGISTKFHEEYPEWAAIAAKSMAEDSPYYFFDNWLSLSKKYPELEAVATHNLARKQPVYFLRNFFNFYGPELDQVAVEKLMVRLVTQTSTTSQSFLNDFHSRAGIWLQPGIREMYAKTLIYSPTMPVETISFFFRHQLDHIYPELAMIGAKKLVEIDPHTFHDIGLHMREPYKNLTQLELPFDLKENRRNQGKKKSCKVIIKHRRVKGKDL